MCVDRLQIQAVRTKYGKSQGVWKVSEGTVYKRTLLNYLVTNSLIRYEYDFGLLVGYTFIILRLHGFLLMKQIYLTEFHLKKLLV